MKLILKLALVSTYNSPYSLQLAENACRAIAALSTDEDNCKAFGTSACKVVVMTLGMYYNINVEVARYALLVILSSSNAIDTVQN